MAQGAAQSFDRSGRAAGGSRSNVIRLAPRADGPPQVVLPVAVVPDRPELVLSSSVDLLGILRSAWLGAAALYAGTIALLVLVELPLSAPEPWPEDTAAFQLVFEPTPALAPTGVADVASALPAPTPPEETSVSSSIAPSPEPATAPSLDPRPMPPPPPRKPAVPPEVGKMSAVVAAIPQVPASAQVAVLPPPVADQPLIPPRPVGATAGNAKPDYPAEARRSGQQGRVMLHVTVSAAGTPLSVAIVASSGHELLDQAAFRAVSAWRFTPATRGGAAVSGAVDVPVQFRLED